MAMMRFEIFDGVIAFQRAFIKPCGGSMAALFMSQLVYWINRTRNEYGWVYKTFDEMQLETGMTRREQDTARRHLKSINWIEERLMGMPAKRHFRAGETFVKWYNDQPRVTFKKDTRPVCTKRTTKPVRNVQPASLYTQITTHTTHPIHGKSTSPSPFVTALATMANSSQSADEVARIATIASAESVSPTDLLTARSLHAEKDNQINEVPF
jgi:hypothetical protein